MIDNASKIPVDKPVDKSAPIGVQPRTTELLSELYPPLAPDAEELTSGLDEANELEKTIR